MLEAFILPGIPWIIFWVFVGASITIQGIGKSGFGGGVGALALPLMLFVMPVPKVVATMLPLLILLDMNAIYHHWHNKVWKDILWIWLPSILGIAAGALVWWMIGQEGVTRYEGYVKQFVGVFAIIMVVYILGKEFAAEKMKRLKPGPIYGFCSGVGAGFSSTIAHAAGPIVALYMYAQDNGKALFVGSMAWTFMLINLTKLPFFIGVGLLEKDVLLFDLFLLPLVPFGSFLGKWMHDRVSEKGFNRVILVLTALTGTSLVFKFNPIPFLLNAFGP